VIFVFLSIAVLFIGLALSIPLKQNPSATWSYLFEGLIESLIVCIVLFELLPEVWSSFGWMTVFFFAIGLILVASAEIFSHSKFKFLGMMGLAGGLAVHSFVDGAALGIGAHFSSEHSMLLLMAIIIHRLPIGILLGLRPNSLQTVIAILSVISIGTILGFIGIERIDIQNILPLQAFACGVLGHVVLSHSITTQPKTLLRGIGVLLGVVQFILLELEHTHEGHGGIHLDPWTIFSGCFLILLIFRPKLMALRTIRRSLSSSERHEI